MPKLNRCTSGRWRYGKRRSVLIIRCCGSAEQSRGTLRRQGRYADAEPLLQAVVGDQGKSAWSRSSRCCVSLNNLARLTALKVAMPMPSRCSSDRWQIREKALGPDHPDVATSLNNLAALYFDQGRYADAEPLPTVVGDLRESAGPDHPDVASFAEQSARSLIERPRSLCRCRVRCSSGRWRYGKSTRSRSSRCCGSLNNLAVLYSSQGRYADANRCSSGRWR